MREMLASARSKPPAAADALAYSPIWRNIALSRRCLATGSMPAHASSLKLGRATAAYMCSVAPRRWRVPTSLSRSSSCSVRTW